MIYKLHELFNTRYIYTTFLEDLYGMLAAAQNYKDKPEFRAEFDSNPKGAPNDLQRQFIKECASGEYPTIDLCECNFTPDVARDIATFVRKGYKFIDSKNPTRTKLLEPTPRVMPKALPLWDINLYPTPQAYKDMLDPNAIYYVPGASTNMELTVATTAMLLLFAPDVKIALDSTISYSGLTVLKFLHSALDVSDLDENGCDVYVSAPLPRDTERQMEVAHYENGVISIPQGYTSQITDAWDELYPIPLHALDPKDVSTARAKMRQLVNDTLRHAATKGKRITDVYQYLK